MKNKSSTGRPLLRSRDGKAVESRAGACIALSHPSQSHCGDGHVTGLPSERTMRMLKARLSA
jgi:hypothetical protein